MQQALRPSEGAHYRNSIRAIVTVLHRNHTPYFYRDGCPHALQVGRQCSLTTIKQKWTDWIKTLGAPAAMLFGKTQLLGPLISQYMGDCSAGSLRDRASPVI